MNNSILALQRKFYGPEKNGPPMLPHGDDPHAVNPSKRQKRVKKQTIPIPKSNEREFSNPLVASTLPSGFPEELSFRALAAYSLLRTLSTHLALSPFTPTSFLRALYLPIPSSLIGRIHVALLRKLLINLKMGYHYAEKNQPFLDVVKKRKVDSILWPLRAGDNLQLLDSLSWPIFYDDYCHLTADILYQLMNDDKLYLDHRTLGSIREEFDDVTEEEDNTQTAIIRQGPSTLYLYDDNGVESDDDSADENDSDDSFDENDTTLRKREKKKCLTSRKRGRKRASGTTFANEPTVLRQHNEEYKRTMNNQILDTQHHVVTSSHESAQPNNITITPQLSTEYPPLIDSKKLISQIRADEVTEKISRDNKETLKAKELLDPNPVSIFQSPNKPISYVERLVMENPENDLRPCQVSSIKSSNYQDINSSSQNLPNHIHSKDLTVDCIKNPSHHENGKISDKPTGDPFLVSEEPRKANNTYSLSSNVDVNQIVVQFIRGDPFHDSDSQSAFVDEVEKNSVTEDASCKSMLSDEPEEWSHFRPLRRFREGAPYHLLSLVDKLNILEFLLDEILTIETVATEMTTRHDKTSWYPMPFGRLPSPRELENINNEDWCGVCRQEGDLICCDGCPSSYHRECSGLPKSGPLPEGKWFCPECTLVDPAMLGPLWAGRKPSIEWATGKTLRYCALNYSDNSNHTTGVGHLLSSSVDRLDTGPSVVDDTEPEYLCVHGFLFYKEKGQILMNPPSPLRGDCLISHMLTLGSETCSSWPLVQIPVSQPIFRDVNVLPASSGSKYISSVENYNPCLYENKYSPRTRIGESDTSEYEGRWHHSFSFRLWDCLIPDTSSDHVIKMALKTGTSLFNPLEIISKFMLDLEAKLLKAALLDPRWGAVVPSDASLRWRKATHKCKSLLRLAKLFVKLVDAIHPLAFDMSWFNCSRTKTTWQDKPLSQNKIVHYDSNSDVSLITVMRCWQTCPVASIHCLLARDGYSLRDWIKESSPELGKTIRKRRRKGFVDNIDSTKFDSVDDDANDTIKESFGTGSLDYNQDNNDGPPVKRLRSSRYSFTSTHNSDTNSIASTNASFALPRKLKFAEIRNEISGSFNLEPLWPVCGRKPFPTFGTFPSDVTRYLARNAGAVVAPFVTYSNDFEVGQVANAHVWRKRMLECKSFEEFLLHASSLESYLDSSVIRKATSYAQRFNSGKHHPSFSIIESYRDFRTGLTEYLVAKPKQPTATWISSTFVDLPVIIHSQIDKSRVSKQQVEESNTTLSQDPNTQTCSLSTPLEHNHFFQAQSATNSTKILPNNASVQNSHASPTNQTVDTGGNNAAFNFMMMQNMMGQNMNSRAPETSHGQQFRMQPVSYPQVPSNTNQVGVQPARSHFASPGFNTLQPSMPFGAASDHYMVPNNQIQINHSYQQQTSGIWQYQQNGMSPFHQHAVQRQAEQPSGGMVYNQMSGPGMLPYQNAQQQFVPQYSQNFHNQQVNSAQQTMTPGFYQPVNATMPSSESRSFQPQVTRAAQYFVPAEKQGIQHQSNNSFHQSAMMNNAYSQVQPSQSNSGTVMQHHPQNQHLYDSSKFEMNHTPNMAGFNFPNPPQNPYNYSPLPIHNAMSSPQSNGAGQGFDSNYGNFTGSDMYQPHGNHNN